MPKFLLSILAAVALTLSSSASQASSWGPKIFFQQDRPNASEVGWDTQLAILIADDVLRKFKGNQSPPQIHVVGHADTNEADDHLELSRRRALAVKELLIERGLPVENIVVSFRGSAALLVPTNGIKPEPHNRRVEISFR